MPITTNAMSTGQAYSIEHYVLKQIILIPIVFNNNGKIVIISIKALTEVYVLYEVYRASYKM
jgi:hypothetical protein